MKEETFDEWFSSFYGWEPYPGKDYHAMLSEASFLRRHLAEVEREIENREIWMARREGAERAWLAKTKKEGE